MHRYSSATDIEIVALIASSLSIGQRPRILDKIEYICSLMKGNPTKWVLDGDYKKNFPDTDEKFYRFYSFSHLRHFFTAIQRMLLQYGSIGKYLYEKDMEGNEPIQALIDFFKNDNIGHLVPLNMNSCCKRLNMFFRWMVRDNSPVDMGLWTWFDKRMLIMPVDTHVMQEALKLGIIDKTGSSFSKALEITEAMRQIWREDPCRGDFALFGEGVNKERDVKSYQITNKKRK
jgi:uncharacterized protein (TIGR02757 family)